ncbi:hypothetical protein [Nocardia abscessus]|uniref:hypothetical protein n=1 Tax=Nocardia abscessus TaxID=120957 RepID=UPI00245569F4|nr:hypothetical protein [Nocardia abscessus]
MNITALVTADDLHEDLFVDVSRSVSSKGRLARAGCRSGMGEGDVLRLKSGN